MAETISTTVADNNHICRPLIKHFVKAGEKPRLQPTPTAGLLSLATDFELQVDLGRQLKFPEHITLTSLRPGVVLASASSKQVLLLELTVPWEDCMEEANERKWLKYHGSQRHAGGEAGKPSVSQ